MRYVLLDQHRGKWSLQFACEALAVSPGSYYQWRKRPPSAGYRQLPVVEYKINSFCLPKDQPATVQLGNNCRAMLLNLRLRPGITLDRVELETLSPEVIIGLMGVTVMTGR